MKSRSTEYIYLLHRHILEAAALVGVERDELIESISNVVPINLYANGSIGFSEERGYLLFDEVAGRRLRELALGLDETLGPTNMTSVLGGSLFGGLKDIGPAVVQMYFWGNYTRQLESNYLRIGTAIDRGRFSIEEWPLESMEVTIALKGRAAASTYKAIAQFIKNWQCDWAAKAGDAPSPIELFELLGKFRTV